MILFLDANGLVAWCSWIILGERKKKQIQKIISLMNKKQTSCRHNYSVYSILQRIKQQIEMIRSPFDMISHMLTTIFSYDLNNWMKNLRLSFNESHGGSALTNKAHWFFPERTPLVNSSSKPTRVNSFRWSFNNE